MVAFSCSSTKANFDVAVDGDEQVELALLRPNLGDVDMKVADRIALEFGLVWLVAVHLRQPADPMALKAAVQG